MAEDIRDKAFISHEDAVGLNFIRAAGPYVFRRHYRQGLRSHILEILKKADVELESVGTVSEGTRWFPRARPVRMFRIFRTRLNTLKNALSEIRRVRIVERYLAPDFMASSNEFIVDYMGPEGRDLMLCGFQEYKQGEIVDPWSILDRRLYIDALYDSLAKNFEQLSMTKEVWATMARQKATVFIQRIKKMISEVGYIPDLAGIGNLVIEPAGEIKLVDINNISKVAFGGHIPLDDRGYPVCDKSVEALQHIEDKMGVRPADKNEPVYRAFLNRQRMRSVKVHEENFYRQRANSSGYPALQR